MSICGAVDAPNKIYPKEANEIDKNPERSIDGYMKYEKLCEVKAKEIIFPYAILAEHCGFDWYEGKKGVKIFLLHQYKNVIKENFR